MTEIRKTKYDLEERTAKFGENIIEFCKKIKQDAKKEAQETKHWLRMMSFCLPEKKDELRRLWQEAQEFTLIFGKILSSSK